MTPAETSALIGALDEPVLLIDRAWTIVDANEAASDVFGVSLVGNPLVRAVRHPEAIRAVTAVMDGRAQDSADFTLSAPDPVPYRLTAAAMSGTDSGDAAIVIALKDMSPLQTAQRMRSDFVANVSHELRSPLTTLTGLIETLSGPAKDDPEAQVRFLAIMAQEAARMDRLIDDLLSLSRVEADERVRPTRRIDLVSIIEPVIAIMQERPESDKRKIAFEHDAQSCFVIGDSDQLTQVFQNLLENAIKYSRAGGTVSIQLEKRESAALFSTPVWAVSISDEGEGIAAEHIPRLTERFYRVDSGRSRQMGGTGLGLAIVKHILSRHRGRLSISSRPGAGTNVTVLLPVAI